MFWKILTIIVLFIIHKYFYERAYNAKIGGLKEFIFMFLTIIVTLIISCILFLIVVK